MANGERTERTERGERGGRERGERTHRGQRPGPAAENATGRYSDARIPGGPGYLGDSAPPVPAPTWKRRLYIDRPADLAALAADLQRAHVIAIDAEFAQVRIRRPDEPSHRLALLQLAADNDYTVSYVVDALRLADLSPLRAPFENGAILKLFHGIGADARVLATRGLVAHHTLDLEAVSRSIFGQRESGLQTMLLRATGVRLDKSLQRADWSRRPLTPAMVAYAARDAEVTLVLYGWLGDNYSWAVALHEVPADEPDPAVAEWIVPFLEGARPRQAVLAVADAGLSSDVAAQRRDLAQALATVRHPSQRARVMRLITDLELAGLAPDFHTYLDAPASEERAGAARALGRFHDASAAPALRALLADPVQDVRQAAQLALDNLTHTPHPARLPRASRNPSGGPVKWSSESDGASTTAAPSADWQDALRARFGIASTPPDDDPAAGE